MKDLHRKSGNQAQTHHYIPQNGVETKQKQGTISLNVLSLSRYSLTINMSSYRSDHLRMFEYDRTDRKTRIMTDRSNPDKLITVCLV